MSIWRSALSILGAFFVVAVLVGIATAVASNVMLGSMGPDVEVTATYLVVNLAYSVLIAVIGGYVARSPNAKRAAAPCPIPPRWTISGAG